MLPGDRAIDGASILFQVDVGISKAPVAASILALGKAALGFSHHTADVTLDHLWDRAIGDYMSAREHQGSIAEGSDGRQVMADEDDRTALLGSGLHPP